MSTWNSGPPPSIGWWPASVTRDRNCTRWWSGTFWSIATRPHFSAKEAAAAARVTYKEQSWVEWTERPKSWPMRSRT